jgi:TolB-like protein
VLPLLALSPDEGGTYSAEGMTEALVMELARIRSLRVISHQSVRQFRGSHVPLDHIARILGVDALVEGSVLEAGGRVRVTAQLVRAQPEEHLWADAFERDARDVISVHRDVARSIAATVATVLTADEERHLESSQPVHPGAYHACLQGWMKHATLVPAEMARALSLYLEAIALDSDFALARANFSVLLFNLIVMGELPLEPHLAQLREAAGIAMDLDPSLALAHVAQGAERLFAHDWPATEECLGRAIAMTPNLAVGQAVRTVFLTGMARFEEAFEAAERARHLDPLAPYANWLRGWSLHYARRPEESIAEQDRVLELFADYPLARIFLAKCYFQMGDRKRTIVACRRSLDLMPENPMTLFVRRTHARSAW